MTRFDFDATFGDQIVKMTKDYGRLNLVTQYTYDTYGDVATLTDANGHVTTTIYDKLRRVTEVDGAVSGVVTKYTYYPDGPIASKARQVFSGKFETTQYAYTLTDKLSIETDPAGNAVTTTYDANDRRQTFTTPVSATQSRQRTYSYDSLKSRRAKSAIQQRVRLECPWKRIGFLQTVIKSASLMPTAIRRPSPTTDLTE